MGYYDPSTSTYSNTASVKSKMGMPVTNLEKISIDYNNNFSRNDYDMKRVSNYVNSEEGRKGIMSNTENFGRVADAAFDEVFENKSINAMMELDTDEGGALSTGAAGGVGTISAIAEYGYDSIGAVLGSTLAATGLIGGRDDGQIDRSTTMDLLDSLTSVEKGIGRSANYIPKQIAQITGDALTEAEKNVFDVSEANIGAALTEVVPFGFAFKAITKPFKPLKNLATSSRGLTKVAVESGVGVGRKGLDGVNAVASSRTRQVISSELSDINKRLKSLNPKNAKAAEDIKALKQRASLLKQNQEALNRGGSSFIDDPASTLSTAKKAEQLALPEIGGSSAPIELPDGGGVIIQATKIGDAGGMNGTKFMSAVEGMGNIGTVIPYAKEKVAKILRSPDKIPSLPISRENKSALAWGAISMFEKAEKGFGKVESWMPANVVNKTKAGISYAKNKLANTISSNADSLPLRFEKPELFKRVEKIAKKIELPESVSGYLTDLSKAPRSIIDSPKMRMLSDIAKENGLKAQDYINQFKRTGADGNFIDVRALNSDFLQKAKNRLGKYADGMSQGMSQALKNNPLETIEDLKALWSRTGGDGTDFIWETFKRNITGAKDASKKIYEESANIMRNMVEKGKTQKRTLDTEAIKALSLDPQTLDAAKKALDAGDEAEFQRIVATHLKRLSDGEIAPEIAETISVSAKRMDEAKKQKASKAKKLEGKPARQAVAQKTDEARDAIATDKQTKAPPTKVERVIEQKIEAPIDSPKKGGKLGSIKTEEIVDINKLDAPDRAIANNLTKKLNYSLRKTEATAKKVIGEDIGDIGLENLQRRKRRIESLLEKTSGGIESSDPDAKYLGKRDQLKDLLETSDNQIQKKKSVDMAKEVSKAVNSNMVKITKKISEGKTPWVGKNPKTGKNMHIEQQLKTFVYDSYEYLDNLPDNVSKRYVIKTKEAIREFIIEAEKSIDVKFNESGNLSKFKRASQIARDNMKYKALEAKKAAKEAEIQKDIDSGLKREFRYGADDPEGTRAVVEGADDAQYADEVPHDIDGDLTQKIGGQARKEMRKVFNEDPQIPESLKKTIEDKGGAKLLDKKEIDAVTEFYKKHPEMAEANESLISNREVIIEEFDLGNMSEDSVKEIQDSLQKAGIEKYDSGLNIVSINPKGAKTSTYLEEGIEEIKGVRNIIRVKTSPKKFKSLIKKAANGQTLSAALVLSTLGITSQQ